MTIKIINEILEFKPSRALQGLVIVPTCISLLSKGNSEKSQKQRLVIVSPVENYQIYEIYRLSPLFRLQDVTLNARGSPGPSTSASWPVRIVGPGDAPGDGSAAAAPTAAAASPSVHQARRTATSGLRGSAASSTSAGGHAAEPGRTAPGRGPRAGPADGVSDAPPGVASAGVAAATTAAAASAAASSAGSGDAALPRDEEADGTNGATTRGHGGRGTPAGNDAWKERKEKEKVGGQGKSIRCNHSRNKS